MIEKNHLTVIFSFFSVAVSFFCFKFLFLF